MLNYAGEYCTYGNYPGIALGYELGLGLVQCYGEPPGAIPAYGPSTVSTAKPVNQQ